MDGIINVYKPAGITSFDVVAKIRKLSKTRKVGHAGTLDPAATGVLPVCIGRATKVIDYIMNSKKIYKVELKLGVVTDTYDREGKTVETHEVNASIEAIKSAIMEFKGESDQVPPMYSALKVNGKKMYELARMGIEIERAPRKINIFDIEIIDITSEGANFIVHCSKGTYIRSLCYDIGRKLGCGGMMQDLERLATGPFEKSNAVKLEDLTEENINSFVINLEKVLYEYEALTVNEKFKRLLINGVNVMDKSLIKNIEDEKIYRIYDESNMLLGLGKKHEDGFKIVNLLI